MHIFYISKINIISDELRHSLNLSKLKIFFTSSTARNLLLELKTELQYIEEIIHLDDQPAASKDKVITLETQV